MGKSERAFGLLREFPKGIGGITVGRAVFLSSEGEAEEIAAQDGEELGLVREFFGQPGGEGVGGNVSAGEVENYGGQMSPSRGEIEVELGGGEVM